MGIFKKCEHKFVTSNDVGIVFCEKCGESVRLQSPTPKEECCHRFLPDRIWKVFYCIHCGDSKPITNVKQELIKFKWEN